MTGRFLPGVPGSEIEAIFNTAAGNEIVTGKFDSPESSAALAANAFGFFLQRASDLPALPGCGSETWPALSLMLEAELRFPWSGGRHPVLDCLVRTPSALIGIESKRFEPYRTRHTSPLSDAYWRRVWGEHMSGYERVRDSPYKRVGPLRPFGRGTAFQACLRTPDRGPQREQAWRPHAHSLLCLCGARTLAGERKASG